MSLRIVLADDHKILREGLRSLLTKDLRLDVVAQADNGRETVALVREHKPDIVVMDISMPEMNGIEATRLIKAEFPNIKIIALSVHTERGIVSEMLKAGASAYLLKDCAPDELEKAIQKIRQDKIYISEEIAGVVIDDYVRRLGSTDNEPKPELTPKEREVLQLLAEGKAVKEIADALFLSNSTVETHKKHIMEKLQLFSIAELTKYAIREGLTSLEK